MKAMDLLTLLGDVDEELLTASETNIPHRPPRPRKRKAPKWLVAACICVGFLSFVVEKYFLNFCFNICRINF